MYRGYTASNSEQQFQYYVAPLHPDIVVFLPSETGVALDNLARKAKMLSDVRPRPSWLAQHSVFWGKVEKNIELIKLQRAAHQTKGKLQFADAELVPDLERGVSDFVATAKRAAPLVAGHAQRSAAQDQQPAEQVRAANTALFFLPYMSIEGLLRASAVHQRVVRAASEKLGAMLIDVVDRIPADATHFVDSAHFTSNGSAIMARHVSQALLNAPAMRTVIREHCSDTRMMSPQ